MYYYVFDPPRGPKEYERTAQIKAYLSQIGIGGETAQPQPGRSVEDLVASALIKRYSTLVAVGGISLITKMAASLKGRDAVFGIIPLFSHPDIAELIGSSEWKAAADALPRRRFQERRVGYINDSVPFITPARISLENKTAIVQAEHFELLLNSGVITLTPECEQITLSHDLPLPQRSWLQRFAKPNAATDRTLFHTSACTITSPVLTSVSVAGADVAQLPLDVQASTGILRIIVGPKA